jgi:hypothetical protein
MRRRPGVPAPDVEMDVSVKFSVAEWSTFAPAITKVEGVAELCPGRRDLLPTSRNDMRPRPLAFIRKQSVSSQTPAAPPLSESGTLGDQGLALSSPPPDRSRNPAPVVSNFVAACLFKSEMNAQ